MNDRVRRLIDAEGIPPELHINCEVVERMLTSFLAQEIRKVGFERAVVGLSGGIDSAVSLYLAAAALGPKNVYAVLMPYETSSKASIDDAIACVEHLGVPYETVDITEQIDAYYAKPMIPIDENDDQMRLRRGNKMARERMTILYDFSQHLGALVVGTSNKSELLLGYGTLHGDMAHAINPIGDLYKTQVRQIAAYLEVPEAVLTKAPTADLFVGQTDENQLGFSYAAIDAVFIHLIDGRKPPERLIEMGYEAEFIRRVMRMVQRSQFKRRLPVIAKISERTIDRDFRYSRDWCY